jgi:DNA-binding winged helix-turn-helix (wHTH) protein
MSVENFVKRSVLVDSTNKRAFEFDYSHNAILFESEIIRLSPHEADILQVLLNNRARPTPMGVLIQRVYGASEPEAAAASIRVAIHSLRRKIAKTGMSIHATPKVGYEIDVAAVPELNRRLSDKILIALNIAKSSDESDVVVHLQVAYDLAEKKRRKWLKTVSGMPASACVQ